MGRIQNLIPEKVVQKTINTIKRSNYKKSVQIFNNLYSILNTNFHKSTKIQMKNGKIHKIYIEIPDVVGVKYDLISLSLSSFHIIEEDNSSSIKLINIGKDKCERINGKFYGWMKPIISRGELHLFFKGKYIPASYIFGSSINRIN